MLYQTLCEKGYQKILTKDINKANINFHLDSIINILKERLSNDKKAEIRQERLSHTSNGLQNSLLGMGTGLQPSFWNELKEMDFPVLLLVGALDKKFVQLALRMQNCLNRCQFETINDTGHAIHVEEPKIFGRIVSEFIRGRN